MLLTTGARVANTAMRWNQTRTSLTDWNTAPTLIEPVRGRITLRDFDEAGNGDVQPLDGAGRATGRSTDASRTASGW